MTHGATLMALCDELASTKPRTGGYWHRCYVAGNTDGYPCAYITPPGAPVTRHAPVWAATCWVATWRLSAVLRGLLPGDTYPEVLGLLRDVARVLDRQRSLFDLPVMTRNHAPMTDEQRNPMTGCVERDSA